MSPPTSSSSSSNSQRRPLHERTKSDTNKLAIRIVPYSPPRLSHGESSEPSSSSRVTGSGSVAGSESSHFPYRTSSEHGSSSPTIREGRKGSSPFNDGRGSALESPTSPTASLVRAKGKGVSGPKLGSDLSGAPAPLSPVNNRTSYGSSTSRLSQPSDASSQYDGHGGPATPKPKPIRLKSDRFISVHEDKTFSIVLKPTGLRDPRDQGSSSLATSFKSPPLSYASTRTTPRSSTHERISFDTTAVDHPSSPPSSIADPNRSPNTPYTPGFAAFSPASATFEDRIEEDTVTTSSPNYRMIGGIRKVRKTDSFRQGDDDGDDDEDDEDDNDEESLAQPQLPTLPEIPSSPPRPQSPLTEKPSFSSVSSGQTDFSLDDSRNFEVIGRSSPVLPSPVLPSYPENFNGPSSSSSDANYQILGESSPEQPFVSSPDPGRLGTPPSQNYVVHGDPSPSASLDTTPSRQPRPQPSDDSLVLREKYSQESLVVPPLIPRKTLSRERFGFHKQKSSHSLRRHSSFSSLSSFLTEGSASILFAQTANIIRLGTTPPIASLHPSQRQRQQHNSWAGPSSLVAQRPRMEAHPHQWSSQLSTVLSEDELSERDSRALSSSPSGPDYRTMSRGSRHSRQMLSISSSLAHVEEHPTGSSRSNLSSASGSGRESRGSLASPGPAYLRGQPIRVVRDVDENGDGITDLHGHLMHKNSSRFLSSRSSDRDLHSSSGSSRAPSRAGSFTSSIPVWAKVYYGSGERKWLAASPSMQSYSDDSFPESTMPPSGSPLIDPFPQSVFSPRRRPREVRHHGGRPASLEIEPAGPSVSYGMQPIRRSLRKMSSSIWSPHLQMDRRASRFSIWAPPETSWSNDKGVFGRRNMQITLFALGWIFPFAWMAAAFLPLPHKPIPEMTMTGHRSDVEFGGPFGGTLDHVETPNMFGGRVDPIEDSNYQSARWWRNVNRFMSIVGLLIIGAVIALAVISVQQRR